MNRSTLAVILFAAFTVTAGCVTSGNPEIQREDLIAQIKIGESTRETVRRLFGPPNGTSRFTGAGLSTPGQVSPGTTTQLEVWSYAHIDTAVDPVTFVPIVGLFAGGATSQIDQLTITFDEAGIVRSVQTGHNTSRGGSQRTPQTESNTEMY